MGLKVKYFHGSKGSCASNIIWAERDGGSPYYRTSKFAMRAGRFPANHPAAPNSDKTLPDSQMGVSDAMTKFRERGYWASCFPEGDGITMDAKEKTPEQVMQDIKEIFGWEVERGGAY